MRSTKNTLSRKTFIPSRKALAALRGALALCPLLLTAPGWAQTTAQITINTAAPLGTIPTTAYGVNTAVWDGSLLDPAVPGLLTQAGATVLRYPGGSTSDDYHWQTNSLTSGGYVFPGNNFDGFMGVAQAVGAAPVITINYGSNAAGTGGADPTEAAAWVDYANNVKHYGVKYWEIGNEIYGNAEYGGNWEKDLHTDHSPSAYGSNVVAFASAMKAKDPTVKVGAVLTSPGDWPDGQAPDWNTNVLAACGSSIDFVIVHWYAQGPGSESDAGLLASPSALAAKVSKVRALIGQYCGGNAPNVQIFVTETNSVAYNPGKQTVGLVNGLFAADDYQTWLENGVANVDWWDLHNGAVTGTNNGLDLYGSATYGDYGMLANGSGGEPAVDTPFAAYYGLQMLSYLGKPGDQMVSATSSQSLLSVHAVKQAGGKLALLLINKDRNNSCAAGISLSGYSPAPASTVYSYGETSSAITSSPGSSGMGFTQTVPPYSLTTVVLSPSGATGPTWSATASVSRTLSPPGAFSRITASVKASTLYQNATVDIELYNAAGVRVGQWFETGRSFLAGVPQTFIWNSQAPVTPGKYFVSVGVFAANWSSNLYWNGNAATLTVAGPDTSQYNFETSTQSWASSGGMITGLSVSSAQAYAGTHSLAVRFSGAAADIQQVFIKTPSTPAGKTVTFHVWVPAGGGITAIQPYVQQGAAGGWLWTGNYQTSAALTPGAWNTLTVAVPANAVTPLFQMGVQFFTGGPWTGTCYVDAVAW